MKRFISILCLLVGASVASYAGAITSGSANLLGANGALQNFDNGTTFPLGSYTSLPQFNMSAGTTNVNVNVAGSSTGSLAGQPNTGNTFSVQTGGNANYAITGGFLRTFANFADATNSNSFVRNLTFTFSTPISEFLIDYAALEGGGYYTINGLSTQYNLVNQPNCTAGVDCVPNKAGFVVDSTVTAINSVTFTITGLDNNTNFSGGDIVLFDNLRVLGPSNGTTQSNPQTSGNQGVIPEPSTYALMGAGLLALGYARRKK